jgi:hypothetical protein
MIEIGVAHDFLWEMDKLAKNSHFRTKKKDVLIKQIDRWISLGLIRIYGLSPGMQRVEQIR